MKKPAAAYRPGFIWKFYAFYWTFLVLRTNYELFSSGSAAYFFYHVLSSFHKSLLVLYYSNAVNSVLNVFCLVPLYAFVFHKKIFAENFWKILLLLRVVFDVCGNYYLYVTFKSYFATDLWLAVQVMTGMALTTVPSYAACFQYAFDWEKIFSDAK